MEKNKKKKSAGKTGTAQPSAYKTQEADGKRSQADSKFQRDLGKAKDAQRRG